MFQFKVKNSFSELHWNWFVDEEHKRIIILAYLWCCTNVKKHSRNICLWSYTTEQCIDCVSSYISIPSMFRWFTTYYCVLSFLWSSKSNYRRIVLYNGIMGKNAIEWPPWQVQVPVTSLNSINRTYIRPCRIKTNFYC